MQWPLSVDETRVVFLQITPPEFAPEPYSPEQLADPEGPNKLHFEDAKLYARGGGINQSVRSSKAEAGLLSPLQEGPAIATHQWWASRLLSAIDATG